MTPTPNHSGGDRDPAMPVTAFSRTLSDLAEVLRLQARATELFRGVALALGARASLTTVLDAILPHDEAVESRLARALQLDIEAVCQLRRRELGPADLPAEPLATLGRALVPDVATFDQLVAEDLRWFAEESPLAMLRENTADPAEVRYALRSAWAREALDVADGLDPNEPM